MNVIRIEKYYDADGDLIEAEDNDNLKWVKLKDIWDCSRGHGHIHCTTIDKKRTGLCYLCGIPIDDIEWFNKWSNRGLL